MKMRNRHILQTPNPHRQAPDGESPIQASIGDRCPAIVAATGSAQRDQGQLLEVLRRIQRMSTTGKKWPEYLRLLRCMRH